MKVNLKTKMWTNWGHEKIRLVLYVFVFAIKRHDKIEANNVLVHLWIRSNFHTQAHFLFFFFFSEDVDVEKRVLFHEKAQ